MHHQILLCIQVNWKHEPGFRIKILGIGEMMVTAPLDAPGANFHKETRLIEVMTSY